MSLSDSCFFSNPSFPLLVFPDRMSIMDDVEKSSSAIHEAIEIKLFIDGSSSLLIGDKTLNVTADDLVVINPYQVHSTVDVGHQTRGKYHLIMVGLGFLDNLNIPDYNLRNLFFGKKLKFSNLIKTDDYIKDVIFNLVELSKDIEKNQLAVYGYVCQLFSWLLNNAVSNQKTDTSTEMVDYYEIIEPALRMIRDNYQQEFTLEAFSEKCNVSKFHFCRVFKQVMGTSAINYLNEYRLKVAHTLLIKTNKQVQEIALLCGFNDVGYFCKLFKKHFGKSPKKAQEQK
ncbi:MAG: AraC family transcriptional regulator [Clostridia bacterium]|nr:AraC family transcriptional regulator [Clostridia bacterium]